MVGIGYESMRLQGGGGGLWLCSCAVTCSVGYYPFLCPESLSNTFNRVALSGPMTSRQRMRKEC